MYNEAYCLMQYQDEVTGEIEWLWNSRDGVTPFMVRSRKGNMSKHINWGEDRRATDHVPEVGDRIFVDLDEQTARALAASTVERDWDHPEYPMRDAYDSKKQAIKALAEAYVGNGNEPHIVVVNSEMKKRFEERGGPATTMAGTRFA